MQGIENIFDKRLHFPGNYILIDFGYKKLDLNELDIDFFVDKIIKRLNQRAHSLPNYRRLTPKWTRL